MEKVLKRIQDNLKKLKDQGLKMPGKNKALIDRLYETQGIENERNLTGEEKKELKSAQAVASWVPSQALDSDFNLYIPSKEEQEKARITMEKYIKKHNYSWTPFEIPKNNENKNKL